MIEPWFDTCILCGRPARRAGEGLCILHDFQKLIELGGLQMRERVNRKSPRKLLATAKHLLFADIQTSK
jgi:hypothetical protein